MEKRPIDHARDAAVTMEISDTNDPSPIREVISMPDRILIIKERSIWQIQLADEIDPDRTNPKIPNSQQKLMARGAADPLVCRTLLQAKRLLKPEFLPDTYDTAEGMRFSLTFLQEVAALQNKADDFRSVIEGQNKAIDDNDNRGKGFAVPAVGDISTRGKAFIQGADHAVRCLWQLNSYFRAQPTAWSFMVKA